MTRKKKPVKKKKKVIYKVKKEQPLKLKERALQKYTPEKKGEYISMSEITDSIFKKVVVGGYTVSQRRSIKNLQPKDFDLECTSVWSFPKRGDWATHKGDYRGNWPPQMARNIILRYSRPGNLVLDQMVGGGTTLIECKLTGRNGIGIDINPDAIMVTRDRLHFADLILPKTKQQTFIGDARNLDKIKDNSIDLIATHPPYANIISFSERKVAGDLSLIGDINEFVEEMKKIALESYRILKAGKYVAILVGDTRRRKHYVPVAFRVMEAFLNAGFILKEDIVKRQWQCKATGFWVNKSKQHNFLLIMHEHLFIFRKPEEKEELKKYSESMKWH